MKKKKSKKAKKCFFATVQQRDHDLRSETIEAARRRRSATGPYGLCLFPIASRGGQSPAGGCIRDKDVGGAATRVVRGLHATDGGVEPWRAVAAVDADGVAEVGPQRLQDVEAELLEVADRREGRRVVYAPRGGDEGGGKLREAEVF